MQTEKKHPKETMRMDAKEEVQVDIKTVDGAGQPDLPRLLEQTLHSFHEVNRGLHRVQQEIATLMQHAAAQGRIDGRAFNGLANAAFASLAPGAAGTPGVPGSPFGAQATRGGQAPAFHFAAPFGFGAGFAPGAFPSGLGAGLGAPAFGGAGGLGGTGGTGVAGPSPSFAPSGPAFVPSGRGALRFSRDLKTDPPTTRVPECNVVDQGKEYHVQIEVPGVKKDNLDILCFEQSIVVTAKAESELEDGTLLLNERGPVVYRRTIPLPSEIQTNVSKATLKDGVLTVRLAKRVPTEGPRRLDVAYG